jgi:ABC-type glycerol-3-phosphate transport system substrate-binding protein
MPRWVVLLLAGWLCTSCSSPPKEANTITLWHWMTDRQKALEELAAKYAQQTGIKVRIDLYAPSDTYTQRVVAAAQARVLPDIYGVLDKKAIFAAFIKNGFVADLTADFAANDNAWEKRLYEKALDVNRFKEGNMYGVTPGIYGVPIDVGNEQILYNKKFLRKAGIKAPPQTFDQFLVAIKALDRVGISGLVSGWGETWMVDCFASNYAFNIMGEEKVMATLRGDVAYTDPDWIKVFQVFKTLADHKAFVDGIVIKTNKDAEQDFALERAAFAFNGSWCVNVYQKMNPSLEYGVMLPPVINPDRPMRIWGGAQSSFVVNASSPRKAAAIAFLQWLTAPEQQIYLTQATNNLSANREASTDIPPILADFTKGMENATHPTQWDINEIPVVVEAFDKGIQSIIIGEKTPQQVAKEVQTIKDAEMKKGRQVRK